MKRNLIPMLIVVSLLAACTPAASPTQVVTLPPLQTESSTPPEPHTLTIFTAASLTNAFTEIGANFQAANPGVTVTFNFAGSSTLSTQITEGAAVDVFASANHTEMDKVVTAGLIMADTPQDFATNQLLVILPAGNPANVVTLQDLARPGLKLVLGDETVPVGKYARQILEKMSADPAFGADFETQVMANVVSNETDVKLVVAKVQLGEADAGIVYISDSVAAPELQTIAIPAELNVIARYPIAALQNASEPELAADFIVYALSAEGQAVLQTWGFTPVNP
jgi:molybdate transport system substrate-binding protein